MYLYPTNHPLASVEPACLLGAHQTEFWDPTSKNVRVVFFHGINVTYKFRSRSRGDEGKIDESNSLTLECCWECWQGCMI